MMKSTTTFLFSAALLGLAAGAAQAAPVTIKFSHVVAANTPKGEAAENFRQCVADSMPDKAVVEVYPNSQLYDDDKVLQAMLLGDVQMAAPSLSKFEQYTKQYRVFDLPFLFDDIKAVDRFQLGETGQGLLKAMQDVGYLGLAYWHNGMKQLSANKPLLKPEDAKGLKFRIQESDVLEAQFKALGANPQKMAFGEVYGALQQGVVDGQENTYSNIYTKKFYEVQDGITESNHGVLDYLVVTSADFWDGLDDDVREGLTTCLTQATKFGNDKAQALNDEAKSKIEAAGTEIRVLDDAQRQLWVDAMKPVWSEFEGDIGKDVMDAAQAANGAS
ncbi:MAG: TRAP transporter substrate-binding protein [Geminicoccaceae bacterium]|nr:TRAP transporter substrate-binding protein [Geminicoccaceae bacterium]